MRALDARLNDALQRLASKRHVAHAIVAVESGDRSFRWSGAAGIANPDGTPMTVRTPFHVASIDKLYTATVVMKLAERGALAIDDPIAKYLPDTLVAGIHRLGGVDRSDRITLRHLLGHTSGLADCFEDRPRGRPSLMERLFRDGDFAWSPQDLVRIVRDDLTPHFPPQPPEARRPRTRYSSTNYLLLNAIVEHVSAETLHRAYDAMLFRPLGLHSTFVLDRSQPRDPAPPPATVWVGERPLERPLALRSFPSLYATAADNLTFLRALVRGEVFDDPRTAGAMQARWNTFAFALDAAALRSPGWPIQCGLGILRFRLPRVFTPLRPMPAVVGHTGSTGSWLFHCPALDLLLCGTVDQATAGAVPYRFVPALLRMLAER
jgi:D-alanyl-D-alanine carboxypeptidase